MKTLFDRIPEEYYLSYLRKLAKDGFPVSELASVGTPYFRIINDAFVWNPHRRFSSHGHGARHAGKPPSKIRGSRFSTPGRGAWYAGYEFETSREEIISYHNRIRQGPSFTRADREKEQQVDFDDYMADFHGKFHDIRNDPAYQDCLDPNSYTESQCLANNLLNANSSGIVYPSVRHSGGTCIACFRPKLVDNVRKMARYTLVWRGSSHELVQP